MKRSANSDELGDCSPKTKETKKARAVSSCDERKHHDDMSAVRENLSSIERERNAINKNITLAIGTLEIRMIRILDMFETVKKEDKRQRKRQTCKGCENLTQIANDRDKMMGAAISLAKRYGQCDGDHHKAWVIDQMVRALFGDREEVYKAWVTRYECDIESDGEEVKVDEWNTGIAP